MGLREGFITETENGISYSMPILAGSNEVAHSYIINNSSGTYTFSQDVNYPTGRYDLLLQGEDIKVDTESDYLMLRDEKKVELVALMPKDKAEYDDG